MPEGEHSWKNWKGARVKVTCRISAEAHLLLEVAALERGTTVPSLLPEIAESWAADWLEANRGDLRQAVTAEKAARAGGAT